MPFIEALKISYRNLLRNKRRTLATGLTILFGFTAICLLGGYLIRVERTVRAHTVYVNPNGHISIFRKNAVEYFSFDPKKYLITTEDIEKVNKTLLDFGDDIEFRTGVLLGSGFLSVGERSTGVFIKGIDPQAFQRMQTHSFTRQWAPELIQDDVKNDFEALAKVNDDVIAITSRIGQNFGFKPPFYDLSAKSKEMILAGKTIEGDLNAVNATLGVKYTTGFSWQEDTHILVPLRLAQELFQTKGLTSIHLFLKENVDHKAVAKKMNALFEKELPEFEAIPFSDMRIGMYYLGTMSFLFVMATFFILLIVFAVLVSVVNSLTMGILERTTEIGTMRSLGFKTKQISILFTYESLLLSILSCLCGIITSELIARLINSLDLTFMPVGVAGEMRFILTPLPWLYPVVLIPLVALASWVAYFISNKKNNEKIVNLLMPSGAMT